MFVWKLKFSRKMSDFSKNMFYKTIIFLYLVAILNVLEKISLTSLIYLAIR